MASTWRIGELCRRTGLTVRTLHHWDHVGLLRPSARTSSGHRLYGEADVDRLAALVPAVRAAGAATSVDLLALIEEVTRVEDTVRNYFTEEQLAVLAQRRKQLGEAAIRDVQQEWPRLIAQVRAEMEAGTDPADPRVRELAGRWVQLLEAFHGGRPGSGRPAPRGPLRRYVPHHTSPARNRRVVRFPQRPGPE